MLSVNRRRTRSGRVAPKASVFERQPLEKRLLFAFQAGINFQPNDVGTPTGYLRDAGSAYDTRTNGLTYGWNAGITGNTFNRDAAGVTDQRYDTGILAPNGSSTKWELEVPNGSYRVRIVAGDPNVTSGATYKINAEGTSVVSGTPGSGDDRWIDGVATVTVSDGKLTLTNGTGANNNRLSFVDVTTASRTTATPAVPSGVRGRGSSSTTLDLIWEDESDNETSFRIYKSSTANGTYTQIGTANPGATYFQVTGLTASATPAAGFYKVSAYNSLATTPESTKSGYDDAKALSTTGGQRAYNTDNAAWVVGTGSPGVTLQFEDYDTGAGEDTGGGNGAYNEADGNAVVNVGGVYRKGGVDILRYERVNPNYFVGFTAPGEWLEYTVDVAAAGAYRFAAQAGYESLGGSFHVERVDSATSSTNLTGTLYVPDTDSATVFEEVRSPAFVLSAGVQVLRIKADAENAPGSGVGNFDSFSLTKVLPATPGNLNATATGSTSIALTWVDNSSIETGYEVQYATNSSFTVATVLNLAANTTSRTLTGLTPSTTYYVRVRATGGTSVGNSAWIVDSATTPASGGTPAPAGPGGLYVTTSTSSTTTATLYWKDNATKETGFAVQKRQIKTTTPQPVYEWVTVATAPANADDSATYTVTGLTANVETYFRVRAVNGTVTSPHTNVAIGTPGATGDANPFASGWWQITIGGLTVSQGNGISSFTSTLATTTPPAGTALTPGAISAPTAHAALLAGLGGQVTANVQPGQPFHGGQPKTFTWATTAFRLSALTFNASTSTFTGSVGIEDLHGWNESGYPDGSDEDYDDVTWPVTVKRLPTLAIAATDANAAETPTSQPANTGTFTLTRTGNTSASQAVNYTISGTASSTDHTLSGTANFPAGSATTTITVTPTDDTADENAETVTITLTRPNGHAFAGANARAVTIADDDLVVPPSPLTFDVRSTGQIFINWSAVLGATSYVIYRDTTPVFPRDRDHLLAYVDLNLYSDNEVDPDTMYFYSVTSIGVDNVEIVVGNGSINTPSVDSELAPYEEGTTGDISPAAAAIVKPTDLTSRGVNRASILLEWKDNSKNERRFHIERSQDGGLSWAEIGTVKADVTVYVAKYLDTNQIYDFQVRASNSTGFSDYSNDAPSFTRGTAIPNTIIVLGGFRQRQSDLEMGTYGVGRIWRQLVDLGYNAYLSADGPEHGGDFTYNGGGAGYDQLLEDVAAGNNNIGIIGYSHGAGIGYNLANRIKGDTPLGDVRRVSFFGTIDAIHRGIVPELPPIAVTDLPDPPLSGTTTRNYWEATGTLGVRGQQISGANNQQSFNVSIIGGSGELIPVNHRNIQNDLTVVTGMVNGLE